MNVYKAKAIVELVITAECEEQARDLLKFYVTSELDSGVSIQESVVRITDKKQLPKGWKGSDLAYMSPTLRSEHEFSIAWHLDKGKEND
jgi:hypothetical protein